MSRFELCKFTPAPDPELICGICMNVLDMPHETPCRHVFCRDCILTALKENEKCPVCRAPCREKQLKEVLPLVQNLINKLTMRCDNFDNGCADLILKEFFLDHIKSCEYAMIQCRYKSCGQYLLRRDCEKHELDTCAYRDRLCENGCGLMVPLDSVNSHSCVGALLALVKDLTEKNLELQERLDELRQASVNIATSESLFGAGGIEGGDDNWSIHSTTYDNSSISSYFDSSSSDSWADLELDFSDLYNSSRAGRRRSRRRSALSHGSESAHSVGHSGESDQSHTNEIPGNDNDSENADRSLENDEVTVGNNTDEGTEYQVVDEILNVDENRQSQSVNSRIDGNAASVEFSAQATFESDASPKTSERSAGTDKRQVEDNGFGDDTTGRTPLKRIKQSHSQEHINTRTEASALTAASPSASSASSTRLLRGAKKHPSGHKRTQPRCHSSGNVSGVLDLSVAREVATELPLSNNAQTSQNSHTSTGSSGSTNNNMVNSSSNIGSNAILVRSGPVTRSRRQTLDPAVASNAIPYLKVPPSFANLLDMYAQEDSSDDESWSPSQET